MLVLSRKKNEDLIVFNRNTGEQIRICVVDIRGDVARIGTDAPDNYAIHRKEVYETIVSEGRKP